MSGIQVITSGQIADLAGITRQAVDRRAKKEVWPFVKGQRDSRLYNINELPIEIQEKIIRHKFGMDEDPIEDMAEQFEVKVPAEKLKDPNVAEKVRMVCECLSLPVRLKGRSKKIREIAESFGYDYSTAHRLMTKVKKGKWIIKPTKNYGHKIDSLNITVRAWDSEAAHMAVEEIMVNLRNHAEKLTLYERVRDRAEAEGLRCGCYESFLNLHKKISDSILKYRDQGVRGLREDIIPAIRRDYTAYRAMECLVGDQHKADYYCLDYNGDVVTLELFCWMDFRTQMVWGAVAYKHYNRYTVGQALLNAVKWGMPSQVYTDWGKPEESKYTSLLIEQLTGLGIKAKGIRHTRAKVRHPQAKPIEAWFGRYDRMLKNENIPGYCKRLKDSRENELQQKQLDELISAGGLLSIDEMTDRIFSVIEKWNDHLFKKRGEDTGKSPRQLYNEITSQCPVTTLSDDVVDYIFLPVQDKNGSNRPIVIKRSQVKIHHEFFKRQLTYYAPEMADYTGVEVFVRYNPFDPEQVWIFSAREDRAKALKKGQLICAANEWGMVNPKNRDQVAERIEMQNRLVKQISDKYKLWLPEKGSKSHIQRIHPQENEARQVREHENNVRVLRTQIEEPEKLRAVSGTGYRPLNFENKKRVNDQKPLFSLSMHDDYNQDI
jgi:hypothetical protein